MEKYLDYTMTDFEIENLDNHTLARYLMYTDRDRKDLDIAEILYWKIIKEINKRIDSGAIDYNDD
jgi:hypothetical protein